MDTLVVITHDALIWLFGINSWLRSARIYSLLDIAAGVIWLTHCRKNFSPGSWVLGQIPADVPSSIQGAIFSRSSREREGWTVASVLSLDRIFRASLAEPSSSFFFFHPLRSPLSLRTRRVAAPHIDRPLKSVDFIGGSFSRFRVAKSWWNAWKKNKRKEVNGRARAITGEPTACTRVPKNALVNSLFVRERDRLVILSKLLDVL